MTTNGAYNTLWHLFKNFFWCKKYIQLKSSEEFNNMFDLVESIKLKSKRFRFEVITEEHCNIFYDSQHLLEWFFVGHYLSNGAVAEINKNSLHRLDPRITVTISPFHVMFYLIICALSVFIIGICLIKSLWLEAILTFSTSLILFILARFIFNISVGLFKNELQASIK